MNYDDWKLETPEEEDYRLGADRPDWMEEHADYLLEDKREREETETCDEREGNNERGEVL